jgi:hypothetical protein
VFTVMAKTSPAYADAFDHLKQPNKRCCPFALTHNCAASIKIVVCAYFGGFNDLSTPRRVHC